MAVPYFLPITMLSALLVAACSSSAPQSSASSARTMSFEAAYANAFPEDAAPATTSAPAYAAPAQTAPAVQPSYQAPKAASVSGVCSDPTDLRAEGIGADYQQALMIAQKGISAQIQSTVSATSRTSLTQTEDADGNEIVRSSFDMESKVLTRLENAQDVKVVSSQPHNGKIKVTACMTRSDAMKPFLLKSRILQDSLHLFAKSYEGATHPLQKNKTYKSGRQVYIQYVANRNILQSFGMLDAAASAAADADYAYMHGDFSNFLAGYAIYFDAPQDELEQEIFAVVSRNFSVVGGECSGSGILLKAGIQNRSCKEGSLGIKCSAMLTLTGSSCSGERYFDLHANVAGSGKYDETEAMDKLNKNIQKADWFADWQRELNRWRMK